MYWAPAVETPIKLSCVRDDVAVKLKVSRSHTASRLRQPVLCGSGRRDDGRANECSGRTQIINQPFNQECHSALDAHWDQNSGTFVFQSDVTADGKRFLIASTARGSASAPPLNVVVNWDAGLKINSQPRHPLAANSAECCDQETR
jgi:hypothetical protein